MRLIATTSNFHNHFLVGDILLSSEDADSSIQLPTNNFIDINEFLNFENGLPVAFVQKIYVIKKNFSVCLAGRYGKMEHFLKALIAYFANFEAIEIKQKNMIDFAENYAITENLLELSFLLLLLETENEKTYLPKQLTYNGNQWLHSTSEIYEEIFACGSGSEHFMKLATGDSKYRSSHEKGQLQFAQQFNVGLFARIFAEERVLGSTTENVWGAGFEIIFFNGKTFTKFDEMAYLITECQYDETGDIGLQTPTLIMYYKYYGDILLIRAIDLQNSKTEFINGMMIVKSNSFIAKSYEVPQLHISLKEAQYKRPKDLSFHTNRVTLSSALGINGKFQMAPSFYSESYDVSVNYKEDESVEIRITNELLEMVKIESRLVYPKLLMEYNNRLSNS